MEKRKFKTIAILGLIGSSIPVIRNLINIIFYMSNSMGFFLLEDILLLEYNICEIALFVYFIILVCKLFTKRGNIKFACDFLIFCFVLQVAIDIINIIRAYYNNEVIESVLLLIKDSIFLIYFICSLQNKKFFINNKIYGVTSIAYYLFYLCNNIKNSPKYTIAYCIGSIIIILFFYNYYNISFNDKIVERKKDSVFTITNIIITAITIIIAYLMDVCIFLPEFEFPILAIIVIYSLIFAYTTKYIGIKKNIYSGYAWGYFLGIIGFIIVCVLPSEKNTKQKNNDKISNADEIKKYKELLDSGAITQEEYEKKKRQLLEL